MKTSMRSLLIVATLVFLFSSCCSTRTYHGNTTENTAMVEVASKKNHILLWGLLPLESSKQNVKDVVENKKDYQIQSQHTFVDGLLGMITLGIYTPTTTTYYLPQK